MKCKPTAASRVRCHAVPTTACKRSTNVRPVLSVNAEAVLVQEWLTSLWLLDDDADAQSDQHLVNLATKTSVSGVRAILPGRPQQRANKSDRMR